MMPPEIRELDAGFKLLVESDMEKYRADTFWTKEPETIEWIRHFSDEGIFWDIGANIGIYSLFAAKIKPKINIISFEPQFINFTRLVSNIGINRFGNIIPLQIGISRFSGLLPFFAKETEPGKSGGQLGKPIDEYGREFKPKEVLPVLTFSIDDLIKFHRINPPNYLKIDVDGQEESIIFGMQLLFHMDNLKSILIELNPESCRINLIKEFVMGFGFSTDNDFNKMVDHSRIRRAKENIKAENIIFTRNIINA